MTEEEMQEYAKRNFVSVQDIKEAAAQEERIQDLMREFDFSRDEAIVSIVMEDNRMFD